MHHFPDQWPRGDIDREKAQLIAQAILDFDPDGHCLVIAAGGAPCVDNSGIKGRRAMGTSGTAGRLFPVMVGLVHDLSLIHI